MDAWQIKRQIAWLLGRVTWEDTPQDVILEESFVSEDDEGNFLPGDFLEDGPAKKELPFARVSRWQGALTDREARNRIADLRVRAYVVAGGSGIAGAAGTTSTDAYDTHGENQVTGALRDPVQGAGKSLGRDIDEIVDRLFEVLGEGQLNDSEHAIQAEVVADLNAIAVDGVQVLARPIDFVAYNATRKRYYHGVFYPSYEIAAGSGTFTINSVTGNLWQVLITANGTLVTLQAGQEFSYDLVDTAVTATNLAAAINANGTLGPLVTAVAVGSVVTVTPDPGCDTLVLAVNANGGVGNFVTAANTSGTVTVSWTAPPERFDSRAGYVVRRGANPGDAAPTTPTGGVSTGITVVGDGCTITGLVTASTYNVSIFKPYDEAGSGSAERYSDPVTLAVAT